jgi:O-antigen/teichoic acid export membrane protein
MGPGFESSYHVAVILCIPAIIALTQSPGIQLLYGLSKHHYYAISNTCEGLLNLVLSVFLVQYYGIYGVAVGTALEMIVFKIFVQPWLICRAINLSLKEYLFDTICVTGVKVILPLIIYFLLVTQFLKPEYLNMLFIASLQTLLLAPIVYTCILSDEFKQRIKSVLRTS